MTTSAESEARKALQRLRRAIEKVVRELDALEGALSHVEAEDFPAANYERARQQLLAVDSFADEEAHRLQDKMLQAGGLEPGRVRRGGGL